METACSLGGQLVPHHRIAQVVAYSDCDVPVLTVHKDTRRPSKRSVNLNRKALQ